MQSYPYAECLKLVKAYLKSDINFDDFNNSFYKIFDNDIEHCTSEEVETLEKINNEISYTSLNEPLEEGLQNEESFKKFLKTV